MGLCIKCGAQERNPVMAKASALKTEILFVCLIVFVIGLSIWSNSIWGGKPERLPQINELTITPGMTVAEFGRANNLPNPVLKQTFDLKVRSDLDRKLDEYGNSGQIVSLVVKKMALASEHATKNWMKILVKFFLWFVFLSTVYILFKNRKVSSGLRKGVLFAAVLIFGIGLGSDPSPMGTVKDAIFLYAKAQAIFPPRMIALTVFLVLVFLANKYICSWGCQVGTLQDLVYRINQTDKLEAVLGRQIKLPFVLTNTVRIAILCVFTAIAFLWGYDMIEPIDFFKVYKPKHLGLIGGFFTGILLLASLFVYRPWCHLICPFGLVGWLVEKISRVKISVDYETCIACQKCAVACPSTVMAAILRRDKKVIPDCFACYTCRDVCPTESIRFSARKRTIPPKDHFNK